MLAGRHQHWRPCLGGIVEHSHGVTQARGGVEVAHGKLARRLRVAIGHAHHDDFVEPQHILDALLDNQGIHERQLGRAGVAEDKFHAFRNQQFQQDMLAGAVAAHGTTSPISTGGKRKLPSRNSPLGR